MKKFGKIVVGALVVVALFIGCIFFMSAGAGDAADNVLTQLREGKIADIYNNSATEFKSQGSLELFEAYIKGNNPKEIDLTTNIGASWTGKGFENNLKYVYGTVNFEGARSETMNVVFIEDGEMLKLWGISFGEYVSKLD